MSVCPAPKPTISTRALVVRGAPVLSDSKRERRSVRSAVNRWQPPEGLSRRGVARMLGERRETGRQNGGKCQEQRLDRAEDDPTGRQDRRTVSVLSGPSGWAEKRTILPQSASSRHR